MATIIVPKNQIWPKLATWNKTTKDRLISDVVPKFARPFLEDHEQHHIVDEETGEYDASEQEEEVEANIYAAMRHPLGALWVLVFSVFNKERRKYYKERFK